MNHGKLCVKPPQQVDIVISKTGSITPLFREATAYLLLRLQHSLKKKLPEARKLETDDNGI